MSAYQSLEGRDIEGEWWDPARPGVRIPGVMQIANGIVFITFKYSGPSLSAVKRQVFARANVLNGTAGIPPVLRTIRLGALG